MIALALAAAVPASQPVAQAERAFAATAQTDGQWTAFRAFAAPGALILADGPVDAAKFLAPLKDPKVALMWWPARTVTSCDGSLALSTGPWRSAKAHGQFLTVWQRQPDGAWKWIYDGGGADAPGGSRAGDSVDATRPKNCRPPRWKAMEPDVEVGGASRDDSLRWRLDRAGQAYRFRAFLNDGRAQHVIVDRIVGS